jgi:hypothetical protein
LDFDSTNQLRSFWQNGTQQNQDMTIQNVIEGQMTLKNIGLNDQKSLQPSSAAAISNPFMTSWESSAVIPVNETFLSEQRHQRRVISANREKPFSHRPKTM